MRRALSTAGRQLSKCHPHGVEGGGGVLLDAQRAFSSSAQEAPALLPSTSLLAGGERVRAIPIPPPTANGWQGCPIAKGFNFGQNGLSPYIYDPHARPEGHEEGEESIAGATSSCLHSPRWPSSNTETTFVPTQRILLLLRHQHQHQHRHRHHHRCHRRMYSSASRSLLKDTTDVSGTSATTAGHRGVDDAMRRGEDEEDASLRGREAGGMAEVGAKDESSDRATPTAPTNSTPRASAPARATWTTTPEAENTWVDRALPSSVVPYAKLVRLDRPVGAHLLAWPCFWSIAIAAPSGGLPDPYLLSLFGVGSLLLRGAGCTVNDLWDRDIDKRVVRTRNRPIASGAVSPLSALAFLSGQLGAGLVVLLQLNDFSKVLGASSLALVAAYPLMKRVTDWPQAFLGLTFNWGALLGWAAVHGSLDPHVVLPLYASGVTWTLLYDTVYAHQDKEDDVDAGVRSTALLFGDDTKRYLTGFGGASAVGLCAAGAAAGLGWPFYAGVGAAATHLAWQVATVDLDDREDCAAKFKSNSVYGGIVFASIVAGKLAA